MCKESALDINTIQFSSTGKPNSMEGLVSCSANYVPLSPITFLERSAIVYRDRISIVYGSSVRFTWGETLERCLRLASVLTHMGISRGDVVRFFPQLIH